eukprot:264735-Pelagomonas_calceolata.AAC.4
MQSQGCRTLGWRHDVAVAAAGRGIRSRGCEGAGRAGTVRGVGATVVAVEVLLLQLLHVGRVLLLCDGGEGPMGVGRCGDGRAAAGDAHVEGQLVVRQGARTQVGLHSGSVTGTVGHRPCGAGR